MSDLIEQFLSHQEHYAHVSQPRLTQQRRLLREFEATLPHEIVTATAVEFQAFLAEKSVNFAPNTVRFYRNLIRPFYRWAWQQGLADGDTLMAIRSVSAPSGATGQLIPRPYSRAEIAQLWADVDATYPPVTEYRLKRWFNPNVKIRWRYVAPMFQRSQVEAVISLALQMGLRRNEIYGLSLDDLHYDNEFVVVASKGKVREVPFSATAREAVRDWIENRTRLAPDHDRPWLTLTVGANGWLFAPLHVKKFEGILSGVGSGWELHRLRHTCATERLRADMPLEALRDLLGHASLEQTLAYARIVAKDVAKHLDRSQGRFDGAVGRRAA